MPQFSFRLVPPGALAPFSRYLLPYIAREARQPDSSLTVLGAVWGDLACGAAALRPGAQAHELVSLFVDPQARRRGVGGALADLALEHSAREGADLLTASYVLDGEDLTAMDALFLRRGGHPQAAAPVYTMDSARFHANRLVRAAFRPQFRPASQLCPFSRLSREQLERLTAENDIPYILSPEGCRDRMDPELSLAWTGGGQIGAYILGCEEAPGSFVLSAAWRGGAPPSSFLSLLRGQLNLCYYQCGGDFSYHISAISPAADQLIHKITGGDFRRLEEHRAVLPVSSPRSDGE